MAKVARVRFFRRKFPAAIVDIGILPTRVVAIPADTLPRPRLRGRGNGQKDGIGKSKRSVSPPQGVPLSNFATYGIRPTQIRLGLISYWGKFGAVHLGNVFVQFVSWIPGAAVWVSAVLFLSAFSWDPQQVRAHWATIWDLSSLFSGKGDKMTLGNDIGQ